MEMRLVVLMKVRKKVKRKERKVKRQRRIKRRKLIRRNTGRIKIELI